MQAFAHSRPCHSLAALTAPSCSQLLAALGTLKTRLRARFNHAYPGREQLVGQALSEAEDLAWETAFPHLFLPDFAELRLAEIIAAREPAYARAA